MNENSVISFGAACFLCQYRKILHVRGWLPFFCNYPSALKEVLYEVIAGDERYSFLKAKVCLFFVGRSDGIWSKNNKIIGTFFASRDLRLDLKIQHTISYYFIWGYRKTIELGMNILQVYWVYLNEIRTDGKTRRIHIVFQWWSMGKESFISDGFCFLRGLKKGLWLLQERSKEGFLQGFKNCSWLWFWSDFWEAWVL